MLTEIFKGVLGTGLGLTLVILLLAAVDKPLGRRYTPRLLSSLWLLVAARLALPISAGTPRLLLPRGEAAFYLEQDRALVARAFSEAEQAAGGFAPVMAGQGRVALTTMGILAMVWMAGVVLYIAVHMAAWGSLRHRLRRWSLPVRDKETLALLEEVRRRIGLRRRVRLLRCGRVGGPVAFGLLVPHVVLPEMELSPVQLRCVLCHELQHHRRGDLWRKLLLLLVGALHWFNPAVWLLLRRAEEHMELACDWDALRCANSAERREYGFAILSLVATGKGGRFLLASAFSRGKHSLRRRIGSIADTKSRKRGLPVLAAGLCLVVASGALIGCGTVEKAVATAQGKRVDGWQAREGREAPVPVGDEEMPIVVDMTAMEQYVHEDVEGWQHAASQVQQDVDGVYTGIQPDGEDYRGGDMAWPVPGYYIVTSPYGWRFNGADFHTGMDISGADIYGKPVVAAQDGTVRFANLDYTQGMGYGLYLIIDHGGGITTLYGHLSEIRVQEGEKVLAGQQVANVGATGFTTGPVLQFEVRENGSHTDPAPYLLGEGP